MKRRFTVAVGAGIMVAVPLAAGLSGDVTAQDDAPVTLTIGLQQDLDSPNVTAGFLVSDFELWNLQYATLTDKAADDFATIPGLAESWDASDDGLTYTYKLRDGLKWSDGEPLTADDVAYTINRSRDEEWINHSATTVNLDAKAIDERTVEITSSVPDPKLPTMDVYIVPKHVYEKISADDVTTYDALDGVGSGPYTLEEWKPGQSWTMVANPNYYGWKDGGPQIDRVVFRLFDNGDAMVAALQRGEIDAAHSVPSESFKKLDEDPNVVGVVGQQGGFSELAMNAQAGKLGDGHPALLDLDVRHAIAMAIDRQTLLDRVVQGLGDIGTTVSPSADPSWQPEIPDDIALNFDPDAANALLDKAGYKDTDGDGIREMPDGSRDLTFRYAQRSESELEPALTEFITGWLEDIGIATTVEVYDDTQLTDVIAAGTYDLFAWGWTPFVDPDPQLSYFTCDQVTTNVDEVGYNDANWCDKDYDRMYEEQKVELDPDKRHQIVNDMLLRFYTEGSYVVLFEDADLQAYRTDRFDGWVRQPAEIGPVLFSNTSPSYVNLSVTGEGSGGSSNTALWIAVAAGAVVLLGVGGFFAVRRRSSREEPSQRELASSADEPDEVRRAVSFRFVLGKIAGALGTLAFVLAFNFFLFRIVDDNPVDNLFRGRNLSAHQIASLEERFGVNDPLLVQFVKYVRQTLTGDLGISIKSARPVTEVIMDSFWPTVWLVGTATLVSMLVGTWLGIRAAWRRGSATDTGSTAFSMVTYAVPDFWLGMVLFAVFAVSLAMFPTGGFEDAGSTATGFAAFLDHAHHMVLPALTLALAYLGEYMILMRASVLDTVREDYLTLARAKGLRDADVRRRHAVPNAMLPLVSLSALNFGYVLSGAIAVETIYSWPGLGRATFNALEGPDFPVLQGLFLLFSTAVILANLMADLLYGYLDPRVRVR